jgi:hypothetical protein
MPVTNIFFIHQNLEINDVLNLIEAGTISDIKLFLHFLENFLMAIKATNNNVLSTHNSFKLMENQLRSPSKPESEALVI